MRTPHKKHTYAHDWLDGGGSEGDLMRLMGWHDRQVLDRYAADLQDQRAPWTPNAAAATSTAFNFLSDEGCTMGLVART